MSRHPYDDGLTISWLERALQCPILFSARNHPKTRFMLEVRMRYIRSHCRRVQPSITSSTQALAMFTRSAAPKNSLVCRAFFHVLCAAYLPCSRDIKLNRSTSRERLALLPFSINGCSFSLALDRESVSPLWKARRGRHRSHSWLPPSIDKRFVDSSGGQGANSSEVPCQILGAY